MSSIATLIPRNSSTKPLGSTCDPSNNGLGASGDEGANHVHRVRVESDHVGTVARRELTKPVAEPEKLRGMARRKLQRLFQRQPKHLDAILHRLRHGDEGAGQRAVLP